MSVPQPIVDPRAWLALAICLVAMGLLVWWKPALGWVFGTLLLWLVLRGLAYIAAAKASMRDPEEMLAREREKA